MATQQTVVRASSTVEEIEKGVYYLFKHRGWRSRQVDKWFYDDDAQWSHKITVDVLIGQELADVFEHGNRVKGNEDSQSEQRVDEGYLIPLFEVPKGTTFSSMDVMSSRDKSLKLYDDSKSALFIVSALAGAVAEETDGQYSLTYKKALRGILYELFRPDALLRDESGKIIFPSDVDREERIRNRVVKLINRFERVDRDTLEKLGWSSQQFEGLSESFQNMYDSVPVFRWFVMHYTYYQLYCVKVKSRNAIVECSYKNSKDLFKRGGLHHRLSPFCYFDAPLDGSTLADEGCVTVLAPEGMQFVPNFFPHEGSVRGTAFGEYIGSLRVLFSGMMKKRFGGQWLTIVDRMGNKGFGDPKGIGSLTPQAAMFKDARMRWTPVKDEIGPARRMPLRNGQKEHRYVLELMLVPRMGVRTLCYFVVMMMCLALLSLPLLSEGKIGSFSVPAIANLVPLATMIMSSMDGSRYIRREALIFPKVLAVICVALSVLLLMNYMVICDHLSVANEKLEVAKAEKNVVLQGEIDGRISYLEGWGSNILGLGVAVSILLLISFAAWWFPLWRVTRSWHAQEEFYSSFNVSAVSGSLGSENRGRRFHFPWRK